MKFHSPTPEPLHIALTSGHTAVIQHEGSTLHPMFVREAMARGAIPETQFGAGAEVVLGIQSQLPSAEATRATAIRDAITAMMDGSVEGDFNADGKPNLNRLKANVGFEVTREEADAAFVDVAAG